MIPVAEGDFPIDMDIEDVIIHILRERNEIRQCNDGWNDNNEKVFKI
jgi:hypothetical protein